MGKRKHRPHSKLLAEFLCSNEGMRMLKAIDEGDIFGTTARAADLLAKVHDLHPNVSKSMVDFLRWGVNYSRDSAVLRNSPVSARLQHLHWMQEQYASARAVKQSQGIATHGDKRKLTDLLGLRAARYSFESLLNDSQLCESLEIKLVKRPPGTVKGRPIKRYTYMSDVPDEDAYHVSAEAGFYIVEPNESVIFYSEDSDGQHQIELVVIRGVACGTDGSDSFFEWNSQIAAHAVRDRRNVRPTHPGQMVQAGLNTGPRHARMFGVAKSFVKKLGEVLMIEFDQEVIAGCTIFWYLALAHLPTEITDSILKTLEEAGLPRLHTRNVAKGEGIKFTFGEREFTFPTMERCPPEIYITTGYCSWTHIDNSYEPFAISFNVYRHVPSESPFDGGASFVDVDLKIVVKQAVGTMTAFRPAHLHGTTLTHGAVNAGYSIAFSQRVLDAYEKLKSMVDHNNGEATGESSEGAGSGNPLNPPGMNQKSDSGEGSD